MSGHLKSNTLLQGGKYKILSFISSGGFGCTYEAVHTILKTRVAIKEFFKDDFCNRDEKTNRVTVGVQSKVEVVAKLKKKFLEEATSVFNMKHPGIVRVTDLFEENGTAYYVMDFIDGSSLGDLLKSRGKLPEKEALVYILQVVDALQYVHARNRLHLDIKPGNIMIDKHGKAILIDFGASKHYKENSGEQESTLLGVNTPGYTPLEQFAKSFSKFNPATDIYALGATLYKLLTGTTPPNVIYRVDNDILRPLPSTVSEPTRNAVTAAMQIKSLDRPQNLEEFKKILGVDIAENEVVQVIDGKSTIGHKSYTEDDTVYDKLADVISEEGSNPKQIDTNIENISQYEYEEDEPSFIKKNWMFIFIGIVLIGGIYFCSNRNSSQPSNTNIANYDTLGLDTTILDTIENCPNVVSENKRIVSNNEKMTVKLPNSERPKQLNSENATLYESQETVKSHDIDKIYDTVENMPIFPGGMQNLMSWLGSNIKYPVIAEENGIQGRVIVTFVVERDGAITNIKVVRAVDPSLDKEAIRVVSIMPKWKPGMKQGEAVRVKYTLPIIFRLTEAEIKSFAPN